MSWTAGTDLAGLPDAARAELDRIAPVRLPQGTQVFGPGGSAEGFPVVVSGRIDVYLVGPGGRDILLYAVEPGQSCVQTTLGLLGGEPYTGEAVTARDSTVAMVPRRLFLRLMDEAAPFRALVFRAFAERMQSTMHVLEKVAFYRIEARLAEALIALAENGRAQVTQAALASRIGSAREVVSRQLDSFARRGWVIRERGQITLTDVAALRRLARFGDQA